jgi:hypothetical protein
VYETADPKLPFYFPDGAVLDAFMFGSPQRTDAIPEMLALGFQLTQAVQFYSATRNPYETPTPSIMHHVLTCTHYDQPLYMNKLYIQSTHSRLLKLTTLYRTIFKFPAPAMFASAHGLQPGQFLHVGIFMDVRRHGPNRGPKFRTEPRTVGMQYPLLEDIQQQCQSDFLETAINILTYERSALYGIDSAASKLLDRINNQNYELVDNLSLPAPDAASLAVMTYNVSWESLECRKSATSCCPEPGVNECTTSIAHTIATVLKDGAVDFVAMQEIRPDREMQWPTLAREIGTIFGEGANFLDTQYSPLFATPDQTSGIMLLYNRQRFAVMREVVGDFLRPSPDLWAAIKDQLTLSPIEQEALEFDARLQEHPLSDASGRPYQIVLFRGMWYPVIVVNVHMPHKKEMRKVNIPYAPHTADLWTARFEEIMTATVRIQLERSMADALADSNVSIVICGDFNRDPAPFINRFVGRQRNVAGPQDVITTCCVTPDRTARGDTTYELAFDHIYSSFGRTTMYKALKQHLTIPASDHLPVVARFVRMDRGAEETAGAEIEEFIFQGEMDDEAADEMDEDFLEKLFVLQPMLRPILTVPIFREMFCNVMFPAVVFSQPGFELDLSIENLSSIFLSLASALIDTKIPGAFLNKNRSRLSLFPTWKRMVALGLDSTERYMLLPPALRERLDSLPKYGVIPRFYRIMQSSSGSVNYYLRFLPHNYDIVDARGAVGVLDTRPGSAKRVSKYLQLVLDPNIPHMTGVLSGDDIDWVLADDSYPGILPHTVPEFVLTNLTQRFVHIFFHYLFKTRPWITITLYRGLQATPAFPMPKVGELIREDGIMYTTFNQRHAETYLARENKAGSGTTPYLLKFTNARVPCTVNYGDLFIFNNDYAEYELILPPGTVISVDSKEYPFGGPYPVFECTLLNLDAAWVNQPYAPLADLDRGRLLYKDNDQTLGRLAQDESAKGAFLKMDALFEELVGFVGKHRPIVNECTSFIESLGTHWTTQLPGGYSIPLTTGHSTHAHMDLVSVIRGSTATTATTATTGSTGSTATTGSTELRSPYPASILIPPEKPFVPVTRLQKRQVQTLVHLPAVEQRARAVRGRLAARRKLPDDDAPLTPAKKMQPIRDFLISNLEFQIAAGEEVTDGRRTGIVESVTPHHTETIGADSVKPLDDYQLGMSVGSVVKWTDGRKGEVVEVLEDAESGYMVEFPEQAVVQFVDAMGRAGDRETLSTSQLRRAQLPLTRQDFLVLIRFPKVGMDAASWKLVNDAARWNALYTTHRNIVRSEIIGDGVVVMGILVVQGFVTRNDMVRAILEAFPMPADLITDANLGLGVTGFVRRDPSQPTSEEKEILMRNHSATYESRPMVITQEPQYYQQWQEFNTRTRQRRYKWIVSGLKKKD